MEIGKKIVEFKKKKKNVTKYLRTSLYILSLL